MDKEIEEMATAISNFVNRHGNYSNLMHLAELMVNDHPTLQQAKMRLFVAFVREMAKRPYVEDARNEASVKLAQGLVTQWGDGPSLPFI